ncbi:MAG: diguanylate cyclase [Candidatus Aminicenantes bacterium]|nr:diguanylate cyclase [Candidatus Aminicenantes bacterium]
MAEDNRSGSTPFFPWRSKIVFKFMIISLPFLILISLALFIIAPYWYQHHSLRDLEDKAQSIGQIASYNLAPAVIFEDSQNIREILLSLSQSPEIEYIIVYDTQGKEISRFSRSETVTINPEDIRQTGYTTNKKTWNLYTEIKHQDRVIGYLAIGFSLNEVYAQINHIRQIIGLASVLMFGFGLWLIYFLSSLITRPLRQMTETVKEIARGDLSRRAEVPTSDEVGLLATSFNTMVDQLQQTLANLQEARENLEKKVEERTAELKQQIEEKEAIAQKLKESEELFRSMVESLGEGVVIVDPEENFIFANQAARRIFNDYEGKLIGRNLKEFTTPDQYEIIRKQTLRRKQGFRDVYDLEITLDDGTRKTLIVNAAPQFDRDGNFASALAVMIDITERKREERALAEAKLELEKAIAELQKRNEEAAVLIELGDAFHLARSEKEIVDIALSYARRLFPEESGLLYLRQAKENFLQVGGVWNLDGPREDIINLDDCWALRKSAPYFIISPEKDLVCPHFKTNWPISFPTACLPLNSFGETLGLLVVFCCQKKPYVKQEAYLEQEIKVKKQLLITFAQRVAMALANIRLRESLKEQSIRDSLTSLYNRRYLEETLERELRRARRAGKPVSVIMLDIDHFKKFNDSYGHEAGDFILQTIARTLERAVRAEDIVCRYGGEEFTVILPGLPLDKAVSRAELILDSVRHLEVNYGKTVIHNITISAGVSAYPDHADQWTELIQLADTALFKAKNEGRNRVIVAEKQSF